MRYGSVKSGTKRKGLVLKIEFNVFLFPFLF
jgi:hypothetical protein